MLLTLMVSVLLVVIQDNTFRHLHQVGKLHHVRVTLRLLDIVNRLLLVRIISVKLFVEVLIQRVYVLS